MAIQVESDAEMAERAAAEIRDLKLGQNTPLVLTIRNGGREDALHDQVLGEIHGTNTGDKIKSP